MAPPTRERVVAHSSSIRLGTPPVAYKRKNKEYFKQRKRQLKRVLARLNNQDSDGENDPYLPMARYQTYHSSSSDDETPAQRKVRNLLNFLS